MVCSMTAFARQEAREAWGSVTWEIRSVNHRYLELSFRLPEQFRELEGKFREVARSRLQRGKIECNLRYQAGEQACTKITPNEALLKQLTDAAQTTAGYLDASAPIAVGELLRFPGALIYEDADFEPIHEAALQQFSAAIDNLITVRAREGKALVDIIQNRLTGMREQVDAVKSFVPDILKAQREKITNRFAELQLEMDSERLEQEMVYMAQKSDVDEELDRLTTHITEVDRLLSQPKPIGRRLDFLLQELNREANTLGSKSINTETTAAAVELKVLIEQIREQAQNIE